MGSRERRTIGRIWISVSALKLSSRRDRWLEVKPENINIALCPRRKLFDVYRELNV
jgi:hypothetical protein